MEPAHARLQGTCPTFDALNAGFLYLEVRCLGCDTHQTVALDIVRRPKSTPIHELERYMRGLLANARLIGNPGAPPPALDEIAHLVGGLPSICVKFANWQERTSCFQLLVLGGVRSNVPSGYLRQVSSKRSEKQSALTAVIADDRVRHRILRPNRWRIISLSVFSHSLGPKRNSASDCSMSAPPQQRTFTKAMPVRPLGRGWQLK
jgi:hypothetical protein